MKWISSRSFSHAKPNAISKLKKNEMKLMHTPSHVMKVNYFDLCIYFAYFYIQFKYKQCSFYCSEKSHNHCHQIGAILFFFCFFFLFSWVETPYAHTRCRSLDTKNCVCQSRSEEDKLLAYNMFDLMKCKWPGMANDDAYHILWFCVQFTWIEKMKNLKANKRHRLCGKWIICACAQSSL